MENTINYLPFTEQECLEDTKLSVLLVADQTARPIQEYIQEMGICTEIYELNAYSSLEITKAVDYAKVQGFNLVIVFDQISRRISLAVRKHPEGDFHILNVHQLSVLLASLIINSNGAEDGIFLKSFRITEILEKLVNKNFGKCVNFFPEEPDDFEKNILQTNERVLMYVNDNQEFYLEGEDTVLQVILYLLQEEIKQRENGKTLFDNLIALYRVYGFFKEKVLSVTIRNKSQYKHYSNLLDGLRRNIPSMLNNFDVKMMVDYKKGQSKNLLTGKVMKIDAATFNGVMIIFEEAGSVIIELTQEKVNYYISLRSSLNDKENYGKVDSNCNVQIVKVLEALNRTTLVS